MHFYERLRSPVGIIVLIAAILWIVFGILWWTEVYASPSRIFSDMLENNLDAKSVTKHESSSQQGAVVNQSIELQFGKQEASRWLATIKQSDGTTIKTDSIGTPTAGYVRYISIQTKRKTKNGQPYNFKPVLNVWGKSDKTKTSLDVLFAQSILNDDQNAPLPPIGNLTDNQRNSLLGFINANHIFAANYGKVQRKAIDGQQVYVYPVTVKLEAYAEMLQKFAKNMGLDYFDNLNPSTYKDSPPADIDLAVDTSSRQLVQVTYKAGNYTETYTDWNSGQPIQIPGKTIPVSQLEQRLQKLQ